jgi:hypothetical protein
VASLLDPLGLWSRSAGIVRVGVRVAGWTEQQALALLRSRLDATRPPLALSSGSSTGPTRAPGLGDKMRTLLDRALEQSTRSGQAELFHRILDQLVPDEARILGALSDGSVSPLVHIHERSVSGGLGKPVLENASLVGRTANLALPILTANYVGHLRSLGLVETGPEDPALKQDYEILMAETHILRAVKAATRGPIPARVEKYTLQLSVLGRSLWEATAGADQ